MANLTGEERSNYVRNMFSQIAERYDLMNRIMTFGQDTHWRAEVLQKAGLRDEALLLDLGTGTGDLAFDAGAAQPGVKTVAADFTLDMMLIGKQRRNIDDAATNRLFWSGADATQLPFCDDVFDGVVSGFLLRNVNDLGRCLGEQFRVLVPGGRITTLDTTPTNSDLLAPMIHFYTHRIVPFLGDVVAGSSDAYTYLPESTEQFLAPEQLALRLHDAGFINVGYKRIMFDTVAIHWGTKPEEFGRVS